MIPRRQRDPLMLLDLHSDSDHFAEEGVSGMSSNHEVINDMRNVQNLQSRTKRTPSDKFSIEELLHAIYMEVGGNSLKRAHFYEALEHYFWKNGERGRLSIKEHGERGAKSSSSFFSKNMKISFFFGTEPNRSSLPSLKDFLFNILSSIKCLSVERDSLRFPNNIFISSLDRYSHDYEEICLLGEGAYGAVYKARHRLDGKEYALKKVQLRLVSTRECESLLGEVKLLSAMNHPNVAHYSCSWLQLDHVTPRTRERDQVYTHSSLPSGRFEEGHHPIAKLPTKVSVNRLKAGTHVSSASSSIVFEHSNRRERLLTRERRPSSFSKQLSTKDLQTPFENLNLTLDDTQNFYHWSTDWSTSSSTTTSSSSSDLSSFVAASSTKQSRNMIVPMCRRGLAVLRVPTLYIQMELGRECLLAWIQRRNQSVRTKNFYWSDVELQTHLKIFREILFALEYIHSKDIVHRDIKPANILISTRDGRVLLADFGLAKLFLKSEFNSKTILYPEGQRFPSSCVGTPTYCAPEVNSGGIYDAKVDIYSLGIILLELIVPFSSMSERAKVIEELKTHRKVDHSLKAKWKYFLNLVLAMTERNPSYRPTASQILTQIDRFCTSRFNLSETNSSHDSSVPFANSPLRNPQHIDLRKLEKNLVRSPSTKSIKRSRTLPTVLSSVKSVVSKRSPRLKTSRESLVQNYIKLVQTRELVKDKEIAELKRKVRDLEKKVEELER